MESNDGKGKEFVQMWALPTDGWENNGGEAGAGWGGRLLVQAFSLFASCSTHELLRSIKPSPAHAHCNL